MSLSHPPQSYSSLLHTIKGYIPDPQRALDRLPMVARSLLLDSNIPLNRTVDPLPYAHALDQAPFKTKVYDQLVKDDWVNNYRERPAGRPEEVKDRGLHATGLVRAHEEMKKKWEMGNERSFTGYWAEGKHSSSTGMDELESVGLDHMQVGLPNLGKFLIVRTLVVPFIRIVLTTVVEDFMGRAVNLEINNLPIGDLDSSDLAVLLPIGTYLCIKEPTWVERMTDTSNYIAVHSPSDLIRLHPDDDLLINYGWPDPINTPQPLPPTFDFKASGNAYFAQKKYILAAARYTQGLSHAISCSATLLNTATLILNRAAAHIESRNWQQAHDDCASALRLSRQYHGTKLSVERSKFEAKVWYRRGRALEGGENYVDAVGNYEVALKRVTIHPDAVQGIARCKARIAEVEKGEYDWMALFHAGVDLETRPNLSAASFTGPIAVEYTSKGLQDVQAVAKRDISLGELLLVEKPIAVGWPDNSQRKRTLTRVDLSRHVANGTPMLDLVSSLVRRCVDDPNLILSFETLFAGPKYPRKPLDSPHEEDRSRALPRDILVEKLELICHYNAFTLSPLTKMTFPHINAAPLTLESPTALYCRGSSFNHSCTPNAIAHTVGDLLVIRAREEIKEGEQVTIAYQDGGPSKCQLHMGHFAGRCTCPLCTRDVEAPPATIAKRDKTLYSLTYASLGTMDSPNRKLLKMTAHHKQVQTISHTLESTYPAPATDPRRPGMRKPYLEIAYILLAVDALQYVDIAEHFILEAARATGFAFLPCIDDKGVPNIKVLAVPYDIPSVDSFLESVLYLRSIAVSVMSPFPTDRVRRWTYLSVQVHTVVFGEVPRSDQEGSLHSLRTQPFIVAAHNRNVHARPR